MDGLPDGLHRYTILLISDLHAGAGIPHHYVDQVVQKALNQPMNITCLRAIVLKETLVSISIVLSRFPN